VTYALVASYLLVIVTANLLIAEFGPAGLFITGVLLIPFDLVARDLLHERWRRFRFVKMFCLVACGSLIAYLTNEGAKQVAIASAAAFFVAGSADTAIYHLGGVAGLSRLQKINLSNLISALIDSSIFQVLAFGTTSYQLAISQTLLKTSGGFVWSLLFVWLLNKLSARGEKCLRHK